MRRCCSGCSPETWFPEPGSSCEPAGLDPERFVVGPAGRTMLAAASFPESPPPSRAAFQPRVPTGSEVVIIGDTPADVRRCAEGIGARTIAVATGGYTAAELMKGPVPTRSSPSFGEVGRAVEAILYSAS